MKVYFNGFERKKNNKVYHYTSPIGLYSILSNNTIRFSDIQFLNDKFEYLQIKTPLSNVLKRINKNFYNSNLIENIDLWLKNNYEFQDTNVKYRYYVFCTSLKRDALNMWNYYVKDGKYEGYNVCLDIDEFVEFINDKFLNNVDDVELWYGNVVYEKIIQENLIEKYLINIDKELYEVKKEVSKSGYYTYLQMAQEEIINYMEICRLFFKNKAFEDEKEYRFVLKLPFDVNLDEFLGYGFKVNNGLFCPYYDLYLDKNIIKCITLSPMLEYELGKKGLELFLRHIGFYNIEIFQSKVPIRY